MPSMISSETLTIDKIDVSPLNVRRHRAAIENLAPMEASILGSGLIQPLNLHPMRGYKDRFGVFAGGRRTRAIRNLVKRGALPADWPVRVEIYRGFSDVEIIELSLGENIPRAELELYEICAGIRALSVRGEPLERIAKALGQDEILVRKWHRVGQLAEPIFEAFAQGRLSADDARAFAATADQAVQLTAYEQLRELPAWQRTPEKIRAAMKVGDRTAGRLLRFVGADAYRAAGGRFELDLFADTTEERGRVEDEALLRKLADERLAAAREGARAATERPDLRFVPAPPLHAGGTDYSLQVTPKARPGGGIIIPDGDVVGWIDISEGGEPRVSYWWESRKAKHGSAPRPETASAPASGERLARRLGVAINDAASPGAQREVDAAIKEDSGLSQDSVQVMRTLRRAVFRAALVGDARRTGQAWALDYFMWAQLRMTIGDDGSAQVGILPVAQDRSAAALLGQDLVRQTEAHRIWSDAIEEIRRTPVINAPDLATSFAWYSVQSAAFKHMAAAIVAGIAMERTVAADGYDLPVPALIARNIGLTDDAVRRYAAPSAELLARIPRADQLAIAEPFLERVAFGAWQRLKAPELAEKLLALLTTGEGAKASQVAAARSWVHPLISFDGSDQPVPDEPADAELAEAAE